MTAVQSIPREAVTANDCGPAVSVITWILLVSVLGVFIGLGRVAIRSDDAALIFATVKISSRTKKKSDKANIHDIES